MAAVTVQGVTKQFGTQIVLSDVSLELNAGETVGLIGANGSGKTTLFRLIAREFEPDLGTITWAKSVQIGHLRQEPEFLPSRTLHEEVGSAFAELLGMERKLHDLSDRIAANHDDPSLPDLLSAYDKLNDRFIHAGGHTFEARLDQILSGLGFSKADHTKSMSTLSGGQRCRASLAKVLLEDKPLLLLDEPTNHLDIDAVRWLEKFLDGHRGGAVVISHDRYLLDRLCDRIIEVAHRKVTSYPGNYTNYAATKAIRLLTEQREFQKDQAFIAKERAYIAKHLAGQRTRQAQGRRTRLERRLEAGEFVTERTAGQRSTRLSFANTAATESTVLRCDELAMSFGEHVLFSDLTFQVSGGERFAITGPNGTGKTTLLRILMGELPSTAGSVELTPKLRVGYYAQQVEHLDSQRTVVDEIRAVRSEFSEQDARSYLGRFLFSGDDVFKTLGTLSGGEVSRVRLASLILTCPDVLVLDEPTNHLDIPSREVLEEALSEFGGTIIVVSHDRYFLDRIAQRILVISSTSHAIYAGNYSYYVEQLERQRSASKVKPASRKTRKSKKSSPAPAKSEPSPYDALSIEELEKLVMEREVQLAALQERFGDSQLCKDADALAELHEELVAVTAELALVDAAWQERAETQ